MSPGLRRTCSLSTVAPCGLIGPSGWTGNGESGQLFLNSASPPLGSPRLGWCYSNQLPVRLDKATENYQEMEPHHLLVQFSQT